jgi:hypothetical protein
VGDALSEGSPGRLIECLSEVSPGRLIECAAPNPPDLEDPAKVHAAEAASAAPLKKGDHVYRRGELCTVVKVDGSTFPAHLVVRLPNGKEVRTEEDLISRETVNGRDNVARETQVLQFRLASSKKELLKELAGAALATKAYAEDANETAEGGPGSIVRV